MSQSTWGLLLLLAVSLALPAVMILASWWLGRPKRGKSLTDLDPYECGKQPFTSARHRFSVKFYLIAVLFILFDIEAAFLYPWAIELKDQASGMSSWFVLGEMFVFFAILIVGFVYVWSRGALDWER